MNKLKNWFSWILTVLIIIILFGVIFLTLEIAVLNKQFFVELGLIATLSIQMRFLWYSWTEYRVDDEEEVIDLIDTYDKNVLKSVTNTEDFEDFMVVLNEENRINYIQNKMRNRNKDNLAVKQWWKIWWIIKAKKNILPEWEKFLNEEADRLNYSQNDIKSMIKDYKNHFKLEFKRRLETEIGILRFNRLDRIIGKKASRLRKVTSIEIMTRGTSKIIIDVRSKAKSKKAVYHSVSAISTLFTSTLFASIMYKEIMLNWENVFRYLGYLFTLAYTIISTIFKAYRLYKDEVTGHLSKLQYVLDRYESYKESKYGKESQSVSRE